MRFVLASLIRVPVVAITFLVACTGLGAIPVAVVLILLGNRTYHACPNCRGQELAPWTGVASPQSNEVWKQAKAADDKAFKTNKLMLLGVVMAMLGAALIFMVLMLQNP